jgi:hypothetical protein
MCVPECIVEGRATPASAAPRALARRWRWRMASAGEQKPSPHYPTLPRDRRSCLKRTRQRFSPLRDFGDKGAPSSSSPTNASRAALQAFSFFKHTKRRIAAHFPHFLERYAPLLSLVLSLSSLRYVALQPLYTSALVFFRVSACSLLLARVFVCPAAAAPSHGDCGCVHDRRPSTPRRPIRRRGGAPQWSRTTRRTHALFAFAPTFDFGPARALPTRCAPSL